MASMDRIRDTTRCPDLKVYIRDVRDQQGRKRPLTVRSWSTVKDIKDVIQQMLHIPQHTQSLYFGPLMTSGRELPNHRSLHDAGIYRSGETLLLDIKGSSYAGISPSTSGTSLSTLRSTAVNDVCVSSSMIDSTPRKLRHIVQQARRGFNLGLKPDLVLDGSGGTYFLHDARKVKVAIFKPADEEPYAENNPRGYVTQGDIGLDGLRAGIKPGEACLREVAAYLLDRNNFSGVPMTTLAEARHPAFHTNGTRLTTVFGGSVGSHSLTSITNTQSSSSSSLKQKKVGSLQEFVKAECSMDDISPSKICIDEVHKIAILDIRIMNADRNSANLLCRRRQDDTLELVPIDHGYSLRTVGDVSWMDWCWLDWPQMKEPLSSKSREYVLSLDIDSDARMLKENFNISTEALDIFRASSKILQAGVKAGLSLYDIAIMCCRNDNAGEVPSKLEVLTTMASELASSAVENGRWHHSAASNALADQLSPNGGSLLAHHNNVHQHSSKSVRILKSQSSVNLSSFADYSLSEGTKNNNESEPAMTQSSASDSSFDADDNALADDQDDCEEWAAGIIADVSMSGIIADVSMCSDINNKKGSDRWGDDSSASSASSDTDDLSSSAPGFWKIAPGNAAWEDDDDEDEPVCWSPHVTPQQSPYQSPRTSVHFSLPPSAESENFGIAVEETDSSKSPGVTFEGGLLIERRASEKAGGTNGISRSQSYSDFASKQRRSSSIDSLSSRERQLLNPFAKSSDQFREYFQKFVDLVIVRETSFLSKQDKLK